MRLVVHAHTNRVGNAFICNIQEGCCWEALKYWVKKHGVVC